MNQADNVAGNASTGPPAESKFPPILRAVGLGVLVLTLWCDRQIRGRPTACGLCVALHHRRSDYFRGARDRHLRHRPFEQQRVIESPPVVPEKIHIAQILRRIGNFRVVVASFVPNKRWIFPSTTIKN